jgi:hypothetical protein
MLTGPKEEEEEEEEEEEVRTKDLSALLYKMRYFMVS